MSAIRGKEDGYRDPSATGTEWPPDWTATPHGISVGRYIDPRFQRLEYQQLWAKVWQIAIRLDEIPQVNDHTIYDIGDQSVLLVRIDAGTVKAYHNVCPHRGTALATGPGHFKDGRIICPFHGWRWDSNGASQFVLERQEFRSGELTSSDVALREVKSVVFAGFVFINFDKDPQSFDEFIAPVRPFLESLAISEMHHYWWKAIPLHANWKVAQEAFFEGYHVPATHPQLEEKGAEFIYGEQDGREIQFAHANIEYETFARGHGRFYSRRPPAPPELAAVDNAVIVDGMAARLGLLADGMDAQILRADIDVLMTLRDKPAQPGSSPAIEWVRALYMKAAYEQRPMPEPTPENIGMWGGEIFIFPNFMILPMAGNAMMYRVRPAGQDADRCIFEIFSTRSYAAADTPPRAVVQQITDVQDPEQLRLIPRQDLSNIPRMQKGMHCSSMRQTWLARNHEKLILNMHQELDRYLR